MKFGAVPLDQALGAILAHSLKGAERSHKKGAILLSEDLDDLGAAGRTEVTVARLEAGDVHEDEAAARIARAVAGDGLRATNAATGRVNLYATAPGVIEIDIEAISALNDIDPLITIATVPPFHRSDENGLIATIKIISYGVRDVDVMRAEQTAAKAIALKRAQFETALLIETTTDGREPSPKGRHAMIGRMDRFGVKMAERMIVPHRASEIAAAISQSNAEVIMILTASATSDPFDVAPQALREAGGYVTRFGMPVDPGNLLFLGHYDERPVIGLPGCARSPALNGADWVLERVLCGIEVTGADIAAMGVGGLLKEIPIRPRPREG